MLVIPPVSKGGRDLDEIGADEIETPRSRIRRWASSVVRLPGSGDARRTCCGLRSELCTFQRSGDQLECRTTNGESFSG